MATTCKRQEVKANIQARVSAWRGIKGIRSGAKQSLRLRLCLSRLLTSSCPASDQSRPAYKNRFASNAWYRQWYWHLCLATCTLSFQLSRFPANCCTVGYQYLVSVAATLALPRCALPMYCLITSQYSCMPVFAHAHSILP